jgi:cytochrome c peroxidase
VDPDLLGLGRQHESGLANVPRNAPTTFNIVLWDQVLFHDGRVESLGKTPGRHVADGQGIRTPDEAYVIQPAQGQALLGTLGCSEMSSPGAQRSG